MFPSPRPEVAAAVAETEADEEAEEEEEAGCRDSYRQDQQQGECWERKCVHAWKGKKKGGE